MRIVALLRHWAVGGGVLAFASTALAQEPIDIEALERNGATIREISIHIENVFDLNNPDENKRLYRWANSVHMLSRRSTIEDVLLIQRGQLLSATLLAETERALRDRGFVADASVTASSYDQETNTVVVDVVVRDAWSLSLDVKLSRNGGENEYGFGLSEENLFGLGKGLSVAYSSDVDRDERQISYEDPNVLGSRTRFQVGLADASDGNRRSFSVERPFYALDTRWSVGSRLLDQKRVDSMYGLGEVIDEFRHDTSDYAVQGGWSKGLTNGRSLRWLVGFTHEEDRFYATADMPEPLLLPEDRKLVYPWVGVQLITDNYRKVTELNDMGRTEDISLGLDFNVQLGRASRTFGSDRSADILRARVHKGWEPGRPGQMLLLDVAGQARREGDRIANSIVASDLRYFRRNLERHLFLASLSVVDGRRLDAENQILLGGDTGLRGYPLRYQSGEGSVRLTLEQRFFTDWYPFRLIRVGYAIFFDAGRTWGHDARGAPNLGTLYDIGVGLRLTSPRASGRSVVHIDLAFPIDAPSDIDSVQLSVDKKASF